MTPRDCLFRRVSLWAVAAISAAAFACAPSYKREQIGDAVREIAADSYKLIVGTRMVGDTLAVHLEHEGILQQTGGQVGLAPGSEQILGDVIESIHRVVLSADQPLQFYVILASDAKIPGVALMIVRYLDDVRRVNASMIPPTEFMNRTIFDLKFLNSPGVNFSQLDLSDIHLEEFLSWQLAKRLQIQLAEQVESFGPMTAEVGQCAGEFRDGQFTFTLNVMPTIDQPLSEAFIQQIFSDASTLIADVLEGYRFQRFDSVKLTHPPTGRSLQLPRTKLITPLR
jgi:hypothetical protein